MGLLSIVLIIAGAYGFSGYLIRRRRRVGAWFTATLVGLTTALQFFMHLDVERVNTKPPWLILNALLLVLLLTNWTRFGEGRTR